MNMGKVEIFQGNKIEILEMVLKSIDNQLELSWEIYFENEIYRITFSNVSRLRIGEVSAPLDIHGFEMPDRLQNVRNTLDALTAQMETAKAELGKPFPQEDELRTKSARLAELNAELNIDDRTPMEQMAEDAPAVQSAKAERPSVLAKLKAPLSQPCAEDKIRHRGKEER